MCLRQSISDAVLGCAGICADGAVNRFLGSKIVNVIGQALLTTVCEAPRAAPPFYLETVVLEAVYKMMGKDTREQNVTALWEQVWFCQCWRGDRERPSLVSCQAADAVRSS